MRILSLSFAAAALALAFTPAVQAQDNSDHVRKAWLRVQARQQEERHKERVLAKAQEWAARKEAQNKRDAWIDEHAPHLAAAPRRAAALRASSPQEFMQMRQVQRAGGSDNDQVQRVRAMRFHAADPALNADEQAPRPRTRQMVKAARERAQAGQGARATGKVFRPKAQAKAQPGQVVRPKAQRSSSASKAESKPALRRAIRPAGGRSLRASDQPRSGGAVRSQGGRGR